MRLSILKICGRPSAHRCVKYHMPKNLHALADAVCDEESFLQFVKDLVADWDEEKEIEVKTPASPYSQGALGWENGSISAFLDAASSWGDATIDGTKYYVKPNNSWCRAAHILHAGKFYE